MAAREVNAESFHDNPFEEESIEKSDGLMRPSFLLIGAASNNQNHSSEGLYSTSIHCVESPPPPSPPLPCRGGPQSAQKPSSWEACSREGNVSDSGVERIVSSAFPRHSHSAVGAAGRLPLESQDSSSHHRGL